MSVGVALLAGLPAASAAPASPAASSNPAFTPYGGGGTADQAILDLLALPGAPQLLDVGLAHSYAQVASQGIDGGAVRSAASGDQASDLEALGLDLDVLADALQSAPPDAGAPDTDTSIELDGADIFQLAVADATARARWLGDQLCITPGEPISLGRVQTAGVTVGPENGLIGMLSVEALLDMLDSLNLLPALQSLIDTSDLVVLLDELGLTVLGDILEVSGLVVLLTNPALTGGLSTLFGLVAPAIDSIDELLDVLDAGAAQAPTLGELLDQVNLLEALAPLGLDGLLTDPVLDLGAVTTEVTVTLVAAPGLAPGHYALETQSTVSLASLSLLGGLIEAGITDSITATATATGTPAASATTDLPLLDVTVVGTPLLPDVDATQLQPVQDIVNQLLGPAGLLSTIGLGDVLSVDLGLAGTTTAVAPDGTTASATGSLLGLDVSVLAQDIVGLTVAPVVADAVVPVGGVSCSGPPAAPAGPTPTGLTPVPAGELPRTGGVVPVAAASVLAGAGLALLVLRRRGAGA